MSGENRKLINGVNQQFGYNGSKAITGTSAVTPATGFEFIAIQFLEETVVSAMAQPDNARTGAVLTSFVFQAGQIIYGRWSSITLSYGSAIGYNGVAQVKVD